MRAQIRIVAGNLRGRRLACDVTPDLRPTPDMVREALFSILGDAIPERLFVDIFAGTGVVGMEALSRGASAAYLVERDPRLAGDIERNLKALDLTQRSRLFRTDAYRWVSNWQPPGEPVNVFISPPFSDLHHRAEYLADMAAQLQAHVAPGSVLALQAEHHSPVEDLAAFADWEKRRYGRNILFLWQKDDRA